MKKFIKENKNLLIVTGSILVVLIIVLTIILLVSTKKKETSVDKFENTILAAIEQVKKLEVKNYALINFPDENEIITKNNKLKQSNGKEYKQFSKGFIIIYEDGEYAFKVSNNSYCATKDFTDTEISIDLSGECEDYDVYYKTKEEN